MIEGGSSVGVTGAGGFIGSNLMLALKERGISALAIPHGAEEPELDSLLAHVDCVIHLAGVNRPSDLAEFETGNVDFTRRVVEALNRRHHSVHILFASSIQAERETPYGRSKRQAEDIVREYGARSGARAEILRLPNVFGKWCRPDYNSVVATFCHAIARDLPIRIDNPSTEIGLLYIDDLVNALLAWLHGEVSVNPGPVYVTTVEALADDIRGFKESRATLMPGTVGSGFHRALHATYLSYLPPTDFAYPLQAHTDPRGRFAEFVRTLDSGQVSVFTALPGVTRGGHYHHSKTEKFLVVRGEARFRFRHMLTGETFAIDTSAETFNVVETVPGWSHDITNIGQGELIVLLWANERFDPERPDTIAAPLG
ncbi:MAG: NAD-dependent epimerase/dehydratase family protein [Devosia sp.]